MRSRKLIAIVSSCAILAGASVFPADTLRADGVPINSTFFPDQYFREYLFSLEEAPDGVIDSNEMTDNYNTLRITDPRIKDLSGLEFLTGLQVLDINNVTLTKKIDLGVNTELNFLGIYDSAVPDIILPNSITQLFLQNVDIARINIYNCPTLLSLYNDESMAMAPGWYMDGPIDDPNAIIYVDEDIEIVAEAPSSSTPTPTGTASGGSSSGGSSSGPTVTPTAAPSGGSGSSSGGSTSSSDQGVRSFVTRLYTICLGRTPDEAGLNGWVNAICNNGESGGEVARGFLYSREFQNRSMPDDEFVQTLYRLFFDRNADNAGLYGWLGALDSGESRDSVINGFINSTEWANLCVRYGINSGGTGVPTVEVTPSQGTIDFCTRLYTTCLGRAAETNGLNAWARQITLRAESGESAAYKFFTSSEFLNHHYSNGEYVTRLYRTFMGREPDEAGFNAWVGMLENGASRDEVFYGFSQSPEFSRICARYGITPYFAVG